MYWLLHSEEESSLTRRVHLFEQELRAKQAGSNLKTHWRSILLGTVVLNV